MYNILPKLFSPRTPAQEELDSITRAKFGPCPLCNRPLNGHHLALLGSAIVNAGESESAHALSAAVEAHQWSTVVAIREWRGDSDELEFYVLRCPVDPRSALFKVWSYTEMWANDSIETTTILDITITTQLIETEELLWVAL